MELVTKAPRDHQPRPLTPRETEVVITLLERGTSNDEERRVTPADRTRWLAQVPHTLAGRPCGCGSCPSIELTDATGQTQANSGRRVVLDAEAPGALLMLFIEDDRLSYLELAPLDDVTFTEFPDTTDLHTACES
jgi:hypothetical protein